METIKLDLIPGKKMPSLHASQYDDGRDYHIDLTENRVPYVLDGTETISLTVRKCDNTLVTMDIANTFAGKSYIEFRTTEQMNACAGFNYGEITIEKNGTQISSLNFYLQVEGAPDEGGITSQSEINNLKRQVHDIVVEELEDNGAKDTGYDNTESGLEATNVQDAIDELASATPEDVYTKEEVNDTFATKTALQTVANAVSNKADATETTEALATKASVSALNEGLALKLDKSEVYEAGDNKYNPALQTPETISPHYFVNGVPYSTTQFDNAYNCVDFIEVKPNTTYTVAIVPEYNGISKPWNETDNGVFLYGANKEYLGQKFSTNTFTTTASTKYIRFNYFRSGGSQITLSVLNQTCMLVEGSVIPTTYKGYLTASKLDEIIKAPLQYKIGTDSIDILQGYGDKNLLVTLNRHGGNNLFDYNAFATVNKDLAIQDISAADKTVIQSTNTDWHSPFQVRATSNIDGDNLNNGNYRVYFTGGNHQYNNTGSGSTATARTTSIKFFANGKEVVSGQYGYANTIKVQWINRVQGYNTTKADGTGREIIEERHTIICDGTTFHEYCEVQALEEVIFKRFYGLQLTGTKTVYSNIHYSGATNRGIYAGDTASNSGNKLTNEIIGYGTAHKITLGIDCSYDLGRRDSLSETKGFFVEIYDKGYSNLIGGSELTINEDDCLYYRGYYIFEPV